MKTETPLLPTRRSALARLFKCAWLVVCATLATGELAAADGPRERLSLNTGWRFHQGDPQCTSPQLDYASVRAWLVPGSAPFLGAGPAKPSRPSGNPGSDIASVQPGFDHSASRVVDLPHDFTSYLP